MKPVLTIISVLGKVSDMYYSVKSAFSNTYVKIFVFALVVLAVAYYFS